MDWSTVLTLLQDWFAPTGIVVMAIGWWRDQADEGPCGQGR